MKDRDVGAVLSHLEGIEYEQSCLTWKVEKKEQYCLTWKVEKNEQSSLTWKVEKKEPACLS